MYECGAGVLWGIIGDRIGRIQTLFGSILLYSLANIANGFVTTVDQYQLMRFITGVGLAGEVGGAITLVSEVLSKERRGLGTALVATAGAFGAVVASYSATLLSWRSMYIIGGMMGLVLLVLRVAIAESNVFESIKRDRSVSKGNLLLVLGNRERLGRFFALIAIGVPFMFAWGFIATFSPEVALATIGFKISSALPISLFAIGITLGDIACGLFSQYLKSRKQAMGIFLAAQTITIFGVLHLHGGSETIFSMWFFPMGFFSGLWAVLLTTASEQFGTNIRATVTSTVPNFVRGCTVPLSFAFLSCKEALDIVSSVQIVGAISVVCAVIGLKRIRESFGISLSYIEVARGQSDYRAAAPDNATITEDQLPRASGF
jgi:MFS family permease